jgi:hypothetical protein
MAGYWLRLKYRYVAESESCTHCRDRVATGRRHPSLHKDVRCLACPRDVYMTHFPQHSYFQTESIPMAKSAGV